MSLQSQTSLRRGATTLGVAVLALVNVVVSSSFVGLSVAQASPEGSSSVSDGDTLRVESILGIGSLSESRRAPFARDPIEVRIIEGTWSAPSEGESVDSLEWTRYVADEDGWISDRALRGGYAYAEIECPEAGTYLLDGMGYRHVYVNGVPRIGDVYHRGFLRLAVDLRAGTNEFLFKEGWGSIRAELYPAPPDAFIETRDQTLPSLIMEESASESLWLGVVVTNPTDTWQSDLEIVTRFADGNEARSRVGGLAPFRSRKVPVAADYPQLLGEGPDSLVLGLQLMRGSSVLSDLEVPLDVTRPNEKHYRSFVSKIDGSVQHYGVTPPPNPTPPDSTVGLILTFHGAGVPATQAHHYQQRDWNYTVAPTNRREFGFDWEDWGRLDALEVLAEAERIFPLDSQRRWLTGHSMGGHGTWNFGAHFPDLFGAIGPSAGWRDFWSYGGAHEPDSSDAVAKLLSRSSNPSRTLLLERNYLHSGVYILHGDRDDNVPVAQARFMRERLARFHPNFAYYEKAGAGHWWGPKSQCMDWPPLIAFLQRNPLPAAKDQRAFEFTTIHPAISSRCYWASIEGQALWSSPSRIAVESTEPRTEEGELGADSLLITVETENVTRFSLDLAALLPVRPSVLEVTVDSTALSVTADSIRDRLFVARSPRGWTAIPSEPSTAKKGPHRAGPFKEAFRNDVLFIVGTMGTEAENEWALTKALFDAETFYYRGNGAIEVQLDRGFDPEQAPDRNIVLYGNAETNSAWNAVLSECPIDVRRGRVTVHGLEELTFAGDDLGCLFVYPRSGSDRASVGVVAGTGRLGSHATNQLPYFVSGVGYPDWIVFGSDVLTRGVDGVKAAGFFDGDWKVGSDFEIR